MAGSVVSSHHACNVPASGRQNRQGINGVRTKLSELDSILVMLNEGVHGKLLCL